MSKKVLSILIFAAVVAGAAFYFVSNDKSSPLKPAMAEKNVTKQEKKPIEENVFEYTKDNLTAECNGDSKMMCAVDFALKCTINPDFEGCRDSRLPKFIFMNDKDVARPTKISFKLHKIKPISADLVEIHTNSSCDAKWFGLCQGRIIYVLVPYGEEWRVKDVYAIEEKKI